MFRNSLIKSGSADYTWNFNIKEVARNLESRNNFASWDPSQGLFPGRAMMAFPENSQYVFSGTTTIPMYKIFPKIHGLNREIFQLQCEDTPHSKFNSGQVIGSMKTATSLSLPSSN